MKKVLFYLIIALGIASCKSPLSESVTTPVSEDKLNEFTEEQRSNYLNIQQVMNSLSPSQITEYTELTYQQYFDYLKKCEEFLPQWEKEAMAKWNTLYRKIRENAQFRYKWWVDWEFENRLENLVELKVKSVKSNGSMGHDWIFSINSKLGEVMQISGSFWFENMGEGYLRHHLFYDGRDNPIVSGEIKLCTYGGLSKEFIEDAQVLEIKQLLKKFPFKIKLENVTTTDDYYADFSQKNKIPKVIRSIMAKMKKENVTEFENLSTFDDDAAEIAKNILLEDYKTPNDVEYEYKKEKRREINPLADKLYNQIIEHEIINYLF